MKVVIDVSEEMYAILNNIPIGTISVLEALYTIKNGTPLPKEHGRLIDADALMQLAQNCVTKTVDCNDIARFPTIIERYGYPLKDREELK